MAEKPTKALILEILKKKACLKQSLFKKTIQVFDEFKIEAEKLVEELRAEMKKVDDNVALEYHLKGDFEFHIKFGGDILVFFMHTNIFDFPKNHQIWQSSYVKENVYNFLADSLKYNRINDVGYLVARFFVNNELHYFVEGKKQLGFLYNDFIHEKINSTKIRKIVESTILYSIDFDLLTPPYNTVNEISVMDIIEVTNAANIKTGKRLGFKFQSDSNNFE